MRTRSIASLVLIAAIGAACGNTPAASPSGAPAATPSASPIATTVPTAPPSAAPASQAPAGALDGVLAAAEATIAEETVSIDQTIEFNGNSQVPDGTTARLTGGTAFTKPTQLVATADFEGIGLGAFDMIVDDQLIYLSGAIVEPAVGPGNWLLVDIESDDPRAAGFKSLATGQNDASLLLYFLYGAKEPVEELPGETLDGQSMQRFAMAVDLEAAVAAAPASAREALEANVDALSSGGMSTTVQAEAWIGADGLVHRLEYEYTVGAAGGGGTLLVTCVFGDFGEPLDLGIPDDADVVHLEDVPPA